MTYLMLFSVFIIFFAQFSLASSRFVIGYVPGSLQVPIVNGGVVFSSSLDALHVADLYARLGGISPLLMASK